MSEFATIRTPDGIYHQIDKIETVVPGDDDTWCEVWMVSTAVHRADESAEHFLLRCREILDDLEETARRKNAPDVYLT